MNVATIEKALQIAAQAHEGQKDKEGLPYILHPLRAMMNVQGEEAQIVVILHTDVLSKEGDEMNVTRTTYGGGKDGAEVVLVVVEGGGHTWPGQQPPVGFIG